MAIALAAKDGNMSTAEKARKTMIELCPIRNIERVAGARLCRGPVMDRTLLDLLAQIRSMIPVLALLRTGRDGQSYNINADTRLAGAIQPAAVEARALFLTDVPGVLDKDKSRLIEAHRERSARTDGRTATISAG